MGTSCLARFFLESQLAACASDAANLGHTLGVLGDRDTGRRCYAARLDDGPWALPARDPLRVELLRRARVEASREPVDGRSRSLVYRPAANRTRTTEGR